MLHLETALASGARKDIEKRLTGKYYTPFLVSDRLAGLSLFDSRVVKVCDPFCGDGRLIVSWIQRSRPKNRLEQLKHIFLFDRDAEAVKKARKNVLNALESASRTDVIVESRVIDTFLLPKFECYDLVITNPPWEQLKPDSRDQVADLPQYKDAIRSYSEAIATSFPSAATSKKRSIGGYNINLARAGALAAQKMTKIGGQTLIVLPSTIFGDQVSAEFRYDFMTSAGIVELAHYPAEARLFKGVDQSFVTISSERGRPTQKFLMTRYDRNHTILDQREHETKDLSHSLPLSIGGKQHELIQKIQSEHPSLSFLEKDSHYQLKLGRELDETKITEAFTESDRGIPFLKGRNINRFSMIEKNLPRVCPKARKIPNSFNNDRLVWRDVSRPTQKRRVQACIVEPGIVTGNSLGIAYFYPQEPSLLKALLAVINSLVFEIQLRGMLSTNHVSQGVLRRCAIPRAAFDNLLTRRKLAELVDTSYGKNFSPHIEVEVAKIYGLTRREFAELLAPFNKLDKLEVDALLQRTLWK